MQEQVQDAAGAAGVAHKYRELHIPVDNIVQDWFWWTTMGEFKFNKKYPDPKGMMDDLHAHSFSPDDLRVALFLSRLRHLRDMDKRGYFIDRTKVKRVSSPRHGALRRHQPGSAQILLEPDG
jgi:alpha-D-xyloside xylohydrolase